jgi:hypothetical protein
MGRAGMYHFTRNLVRKVRAVPALSLHGSNNSEQNKTF